MFILILLISIIFLILYFLYKSVKTLENPSSQNTAVIISEGTQIINVLSKGGYFPSEITAKAGIKTILKIQTKGSFDCGNSLVIPQLKLKKSLPPTGVTEISINPQQPGSTLLGSCTMGMYQLKINFN